MAAARPFKSYVETWHPGWKMVALLLFVLTYAIGTSYYGAAVYIPRLVDSLNTSTSAVMAGAAASGLVSLFTFPLLGRLARHWGPRRVFLIGLFSLAISGMCMSLVTAVWQLYVISVMGGFGGIAASTLPAQVLVANWFDKRQGVALGVAMMGVGLGGFLWPPLIVAMITACNHLIEVGDPDALWLRLLTEGGGRLEGWRGSLRINVLINLLFILPMVHWMMKDFPSEEAKNNRNLLGLGATVREALRETRFWQVYAVTSVQVFMFSGIFQNMQNFAEREGGYSMSLAARFVAISSLLTLPCRVLMGWLADQVNPKFLISFSAFCIGMSAFSLWLTVIHYQMSGYVPILLFSLFNAIGVSTHTVVTPLFVQSCFGKKHLAEMLGVVMTGFSLGGVFGPLTIAYLFDVTGTYTDGWLLIMGLSLFGIITALFVRNPEYEKYRA